MAFHWLRHVIQSEASVRFLPFERPLELEPRDGTGAEGDPSPSVCLGEGKATTMRTGVSLTGKSEERMISIIMQTPSKLV